MKNRILLTLWVAVPVLSFPVAIDAETIAFNNLGTFQAPSLNYPSVTISGSAAVSVLNLNGIGIVGGQAHEQIDTHEFMTFHFTQPVLSLSFAINNAGNYDGNNTGGSHFLWGYGVDGSSLGFVSHNIFPNGGPVTDVSGFFGNVPLSEFRIEADIDGLMIRSISFTPVPEPGTMMLAGVGMLLAAGMWGRRRLWPRGGV